MNFKFSRISIILSILYQVESQCSNRREWRQLSSSQQESYLSAVKALKSKQKGPDSDLLQWNHDQFAQAHAQYYNNNHEKAPFFPWHRKFINHYEQALQRIDSSVSLPYWDWGMDSNHPGAADLFTERAFGGAGDPSSGYCVITGVAAGWNTHLGTCLKRCSAWGTLDPVEVYAHNINSANSLQALQIAFEDHVHSAVHFQYGGRGCDAVFPTSYSANEPLFYLHHAMVDKVWYLWQQRCPSLANSYPENPQEPMPPFFGSVQSVFQTNGGDLCYTYSSSLIDSQISKSCLTTNSTPPPVSKIMDPSWLQNAIIALVPSSTSLSSMKLQKRDSMMEGDMILPNDYESVMKNCNVTTPSRQDKSDLMNNRCATRLPIEIIIQKKLDESRIRAQEDLHCSIVEYYNCKEGYISPSVLKHYSEYNSRGLWQQGVISENELFN